MGFLSAWDVNERIDVSDLAGDLPGTWWIDVKKCLSHEEAENVQREMLAQTMKVTTNSEGKPQVKTTFSPTQGLDNQSRLVSRSIVGWNLTDSDENVLPFEIDRKAEDPYAVVEASLKLLPSPVYDRVAKVVVAANTEQREETASFSDVGSGSGEGGVDYEPNDKEILV